MMMQAIDDGMDHAPLWLVIGEREAWARSPAPELGLIILPIPGDESCDSLLDWRRGSEAHVALEAPDIGVGRYHIAGLHRQHDFLGRETKRVLETADEIHELNGAVVTDVVKPVWRVRRGGVWRGR